MKRTEQQQKYKFEEFEKYISLWNCVPAGQGNSLTLLRKIVNGIHSGSFARNPSLIIAGENSRELAIATANTLCSSDIREIESKYLINLNNQMDYFSNSLYETIHIITNVNRIGLSESVLWYFIKNREYKFSMMNGFKYIHCNGLIILVADEIKSVPPALIKATDFKVIIEPYTNEQLELIVHQRLKFCSIDYDEDEKLLLKTIIEYGNGQLSLIIDFLKICILMAQNEEKKLTPKLIQRASKLI